MDNDNITDNYEKVTIEFGNNYRIIQGEAFSYLKEQLKNKTITYTDGMIWVLLCEYMKNYSTEINIKMVDFAKSIGKSKSHISETFSRLVKCGLLIRINNTFYINLNYATRGNTVYNHICKISNYKDKIKEQKYSYMQEVSLRKEKEEDINYSKAY